MIPDVLLPLFALPGFGGGHLGGCFFFDSWFVGCSNDSGELPVGPALQWVFVFVLWRGRPLSFRRCCRAPPRCRLSVPLSVRGVSTVVSSSCSASMVCRVVFERLSSFGTCLVALGVVPAPLGCWVPSWLVVFKSALAPGGYSGSGKGVFHVALFLRLLPPAAIEDAWPAVGGAVTLLLSRSLPFRYPHGWGGRVGDGRLGPRFWWFLHFLVCF